MNHAGAATFLDWKTQTNVFESMAAFGLDEALSLTGDYSPSASRPFRFGKSVRGAGVNPALGQRFAGMKKRPVATVWSS